MSNQPWTIDSLAHALPAPELRQEFLRETYLATLDELPGVFARWGSLAERYDASRPEMEALLQYAKNHHGELPPDLADDGGTDEWMAQWGERLRRAETDAA
ncbi:MULTISPECIES: hypothetical protein [Streptomyces]|uniref:hypothetical protein n=1 Tax=Streptomyces TaxID=1883 RepID=UPI00067DBD75|nr:MULTISPECIES: hypothetical protein [Streptomyces]